MYMSYPEESAAGAFEVPDYMEHLNSARNELIVARYDFIDHHRKAATRDRVTDAEDAYVQVVATVDDSLKCDDVFTNSFHARNLVETEQTARLLGLEQVLSDGGYGSALKDYVTAIALSIATHEGIKYGSDVVRFLGNAVVAGYCARGYDRWGNERKKRNKPPVVHLGRIPDATQAVRRQVDGEQNYIMHMLIPELRQRRNRRLGIATAMITVASAGRA